jgi:hypothetical protein
MSDVRHLHFSKDDEDTVCGYRRWVPVRTGSRFGHVRGAQSVNVSKARKSDCADCRRIVREEIMQRRAAQRRDQ